MKSDPQLRQDINKLQAENRELRDRVKELESRPVKRVEVPVERVVTKRVEVPGPVREKTVTVTEYKDKPETAEKLKSARSEIRSLRKKLKDAHDNPKVVEVPVERVVTKKVEVPGPVQYVDNPALIRQIEKMKGKLDGRNPE